MIIAGGGIGGLAQARSLLYAFGRVNKPIRITLLERAPELRSDLGGGITLSTSLPTLKQLGVFPAIPFVVLERNIVKTMEGKSVIDFNSKEIIDEVFKGQNIPDIPLSCVVMRPALLEWLARELPEDTINLGCTVKTVTQNDDEVSVTLEDGRSFQGDILIGCDGIRSKVREQVWGENVPEFSHTHLSGGEAHTFDNDEEIQHALLQIVGNNNQHVIALPYKPGVIAWGISQRVKTATGMVWGQVEDRKYIDDACKTLPPIVKKLLDASPGSTLRGADLYRRPDSDLKKPWSIGRVVLIGDAAHATLPWVGQGGNMAICGAAILANLLAKCPDHSPASFKDAFNKYEGKHKHQASTMIKFASTLDNLYLTRNWAVGWLRNKILPLIFGNKFILQQMFKQHLSAISGLLD